MTRYLTLLLATTTLAAAEPERPNVLFIAIDDLNSWVGFMDEHPNARSPNMDRLAARGTVFLNAHCQAPLCGPSRASLMSGLLPHRTGIYGHIHDHEIRRAGEAMATATFLPQVFAAAGYKTLGIGKLFHGHAPDGTFEISGGRRGGFGPKPEQRFVFESDTTQTDWGAFPERDELMPDHDSAAWAVERLAEDHERPFFLAVGFVRPHVPWYVPEPWFELHPRETIQTPPFLANDFDDIPKMAATVAASPGMPTAEWARESDEWRDAIQAYFACISFVDHYIGSVLDALEESPHADDTLVVLWSDHGYQLGEKNRFAKQALWREATRVPLVIAGPGLPERQRVDAPVGLVDLYPTLIDLCDLAPRGGLDGHSLAPLLENPDAGWPHAALTTYGLGNHVVSGRRFRYFRYEDGSEELYDIHNDPHEWRNLADHPQFAAEKQRLARHLPEDELAWTELSFNNLNPYFEEQKQRLGARPPLEGGE